MSLAATAAKVLLQDIPGLRLKITDVQEFDWRDGPRRVNPIRLIRKNGSQQTFRQGDERLGGTISKDYSNSLRRILSSGSYADQRTGFHI